MSGVLSGPARYSSAIKKILSHKKKTYSFILAGGIRLKILFSIFKDVMEHYTNQEKVTKHQ